MSDPSVVLPRDGSRPGTPWWIRGTQFPVVDSPHTYEEQDVLRLREALAAAVESWQPVTPVIAAATLSPSASGRGCDVAAVDKWLVTVKAAMHEGAPPPVQDVAPLVARPVAVAPAPEPVDADGPVVVREAVAPAAVPVATAAVGQHAAMVQRINEARFTPLRFRAGYLVTEVDDFLDELVAAVSGAESIAGRVQAATFGSSRMKECYEMEDVDAFLVQLVRDYEGRMISRTPE